MLESLTYGPTELGLSEGANPVLRGHRLEFPGDPQTAHARLYAATAVRPLVSRGAQ
jgi:hypothetical protein